MKFDILNIFKDWWDDYTNQQIEILKARNLSRLTKQQRKMI